MAFTLYPAGSALKRSNGREGAWNSEAEDDWFIIPLPFTVVDGRKAAQALRDLRNIYPNRTPVIVGSPHEAGILFEIFNEELGLPARPHVEPQAGGYVQWLNRRLSNAPDVRHAGVNGEQLKHNVEARIADILALADNFDVDEWLAARREENHRFEEDGQSLPARGPWPDNVVIQSSLASVRDVLSAEYKPSVIIALLDTRDATEAPAHLAFGNWNACPAPEVHVALARRWHERFGAVPVVITHDVVEFEIHQPVASKSKAVDLALELYNYCEDSVEQGAGTVDALAASLMGARYWYFWWD